MFWSKKSPSSFINGTDRATLGRTFTADELDHLSRLSTQVDLAPGDKLTIQGTPGRQVLVVLDGTASVERDGEQVATVSGGDVVGEMAHISGQPRVATVTADEAMSVYALSTQEFASLLASCPQFEARLTAEAVRRVAQAV